LQTARTSFAEVGGGSPVSSNGLAVATNTGTSPPTLPAVAPGQNTLTAAQRAEVNRQAIAQTNRELAEENEPLQPGAVNQRRIAAAEARLAQREASNEQRLAASGTPVSSSAPRNQKIAKDY
jgi:hypothetical protein